EQRLQQRRMRAVFLQQRAEGTDAVAARCEHGREVDVYVHVILGEPHLVEAQGLIAVPLVELEERQIAPASLVGRIEAQTALQILARAREIAEVHVDAAAPEKGRRILRV